MQSALRKWPGFGKKWKEVIEKTGFTGGVREFIEKLRSDDKFYFTCEDECLENFRFVCYDVIRPALSRLFPKIPQSRLMINPAPASKSSSSTGYYYAGTLDGSRPGVFCVNLNNLRNSPMYGVRALSLHEGEPGHHFQGMYAIENKDVPRFRRFMEDMYYSHAPSKFPIYTLTVRAGACTVNIWAMSLACMKILMMSLAICHSRCSVLAVWLLILDCMQCSGHISKL